MNELTKRFNTITEALAFYDKMRGQARYPYFDCGCWVVKYDEEADHD